MSNDQVTSPPARLIDPELERTARLYRRVDHGNPLAVRKEASRRIRVARMAGLWVAADAAVQVEDTVASDGAGQAVPVRVYRPVAGTAPYPAVLYMHGGAFISGDLDFEHPRCLEMCRETGAVVVSVDYRLAPEHPSPAALDDCVLAHRWLRGAGGRELSVDPGRIAVAGTSAGGTLAAGVCLTARDEGARPPRLQMLLYPVLDDRLETPSARAFTDTPAWDSGNCAHMWRHYLGTDVQRTGACRYTVPARVADLSGLPAAYVMTAEYDPLRDEGAEYAQRLADAGVLTELRQFAGTFHGFDTLAAATVSRRALEEQHAVLRGALR
ncbi:alpha/beta hydrolase [Actinacidiphila oryziradicis]|uniref:Alpha/beta hydrolase n=1 Tax=Actinacidiphila oryziradicis TaxID=2571141 RepID=A0A4U0RVK3_9ACTN|nr:alpha/beta hydrolase [Actinacidiphila oryziradicis]TKA00304.1 alpha/beta hydrolase [Actinacidiphila oryziradicis]